jgi:hypothetical protein
VLVGFGDRGAEGGPAGRRGILRDHFTRSLLPIRETAAPD